MVMIIVVFLVTAIILFILNVIMDRDRGIGASGGREAHVQPLLGRKV